MEYRIKQGDNLVCSYTGKPASVLIQLIDQNGETTQYLSREALLNADKLLRALEGIQEQQVIHVPFAQHLPNLPNGTQMQTIPDYQKITCTNNSNVTVFEELGEEKKTQQPNSMSKLDKQYLQQFEKECQMLLNDPPPDKNGNQTGVPGYAIRDLVAKYSPKISNLKLLSCSIQKFFPTPKETVDFWLGL